MVTGKLKQYLAIGAGFKAFFLGTYFDQKRRSAPDFKQRQIETKKTQAMASSEAFSERPTTLKVINDPIHGTIEVHKFAELIMATPQFQRLRHLKQLGMTYLVYPSVTHSRFEHSVGTYHLAWQLAKSLQRQSDGECQLTDHEVLCVALAGLCHDLGHGPFSHLWESLLRMDDKFKNYHHEDKSVELFDSIVDCVIKSDHPSSEEFKEFMEAPHQATGGTNRDLIKELILGAPENGQIPPERQFLYEIINNKRTGFDVDKWDYINRDSFYLNLNNKFDCQRQLAMLRVLPCTDENEDKDKDKDKGVRRNLLVIRDKQVLEYIQLLVSRRMNHYIGYQHVKVIGFEKLLGDAMRTARSYLRTEVASGREINQRARKYLLEHPDSPESLIWLTDERLVLLLSEDCGPAAAQLMERLDTRRTYVRLATVLLVLEDRSTEGQGVEAYEEAEKKAREAAKEWNSSCQDCKLQGVCDSCQQYSTIAEVRKMDYGAGMNHPLKDVFSYSKVAPTEGKRCDPTKQLSAKLMLSSLHLTIVRLYERTPAHHRDGTLESELKSRRQADTKKFVKHFRNFGFEEMAE